MDRRKRRSDREQTRAVLNVVYGGLNHQGWFGSNARIGLLKMLQLYTEPMQMWIRTAATGISHLLKAVPTPGCPISFCAERIPASVSR